MEAPDVIAEIADGQGMSLKDIAKLLPSSRAGKPAHFSSILRWVVNGVKVPGVGRVKLEAARLGGKWVTTKAALMRFMAAQTPNLEELKQLPKIRTPAQRQRAAEEAGRRLDEWFGLKRCKVCDDAVPKAKAIPHRRSFFCETCLLKQPDATFAQRLKASRSLKGLNQQDLSHQSGVSVSKISSYEQGQIKEPRAEDLEKLVAALGLELVSVEKAALSAAAKPSF
ncbi:hypothetical protein AYO40_00735 [Planctomycetaceae bacterium SCGC AG-212-D15]|nr:hypothetical protein AYO40_00735 [Planctomycetaceae bacterium SCGC AG-212-D15]